VRLEFLGTGGAVTTPRPTCSCPVCVEALERGVPYSRTGPSLFLHGWNVLFDTPEESKEQLNRAGIERVDACFYSHWHPDHTAGRRVFESMNFDFRAWPRRPFGVTDIYLPQQVAADFGTWLGLRAHFEFLEKRLRVVRLHELADGDTVELEGLSVRPFRLAEDYVYAFELSADGKRALVAMDELHGWAPPVELEGLDLAILPLGICELDPFTGERLLAPDHPVLAVEATYPQTLEIVRRLGARRTILAHVEEMDGLSHDALQKLGARDGVEVAWDTLVVEL
jgi:phosphoribosyl 1,2-cyclic phosphate phosphodiesterase